VDVQRPTRLPRRVAGQLEVFHALQKIRQRDASFQTRQRRTQAGVDAVPEGQVGVQLPADVEAVGVRKLLGVAVGRADHRQHEHAGRDRLAVQHDRSPRRPHHPL